MVRLLVLLLVWLIVAQFVWTDANLRSELNRLAYGVTRQTGFDRFEHVVVPRR